MMVMKLHIQVVVNWQLSKQHILRLVKCDHIAGSCVEQLLDEVFCDIHNDEGRGKCCHLITTATLIIADNTKTESNIVLLYIVLK